MFEMYEVRGKGQVITQWFHAEKIGSEILLSEKGKWDQAKAIEKKENERDGGDAGGGGGGGGC